MSRTATATAAAATPAAATVAPVEEALRASPWQDDALAIPREFDLSLLGAKGGGKSHLMMLLVVRDVQEFGPAARILFIRRDHAGSTDFVTLCIVEFAKAFGPRGFSYNSQTGVFRFWNGAVLQIDQCADVTDANKFAGRNFSLLLVDEAQQWSSPEPIFMLRGCLRGPAGIPVRMVLAANPGGAGHAWLLQRFFGAAPWEPFYEEKSGRMWVRVPSSYRDNVHLDRDSYARELRAAYGHDAGLLKSLDEGDWHACLAGAFFASVIDEARVAVDPALWTEIPTTHGERWRAWLGHDYGSAAPSVTLLMVESPGATGPDGRHYSRGSIVVLDEIASTEPGSLTRGMGYTVPRLADEIHAMCDVWDVAPEGAADDACFARTGHSAGSIADEFRAVGVFFCPAKKGDRVSGWTRMRTMLSQAGALDAPGLYVSRACTYWWQTAPYPTA